ncbi:RNA polymerase sigma factor [uncultured Sunxiuqinia sp.]|uniref:RNA polymerase sigma factor n=1 Tax=uncultured Sunxiuqinia sp. TaxID=1573825 RepID=UPI002AA6FC17|nr:RNA polymerase sigma factor [uncultured Sunxiuqinia sp.]
MTVEEYNQAVNLYADGIFRFVLKNIKDQEKARDIVQDSFEKLWMHKRTVDSCKIKSYLLSTAYHRTIDVIRKDQRQKRYDDLQLQDEGHDQQYSDIGEVLNQAIRLLPEDQRSVLMLRDYEGYSYKEISELTALSESQVKVYIYRARVFLKNYIGKLDVLV